MTNLPITSNNPQPSANAASATRKDDATNVQSADPFGAVLARQMDEANAAASNMPSSATGADAKTTADPAGSTGKAEQDKTPTAPGTSGDLSGALAVMLQIPQEIKTTVTKDAASSASQSNTRIDLTNTASSKSDALVMVADSAVAAAGATVAGTGKVSATQLTDNIGASQTGAMIDLTTAAAPNKTDAAVMVADSAASGTRKPGASKSGEIQPTGNVGSSQANAKIDLATATSGKSDAAIIATDRPALHSGSGLEITKSATQSAQNHTLPAASMATSGITSNMLTHNKAADSLQTISSPLGSSGWSEEFSQKISWMGTQRNQVAELHLNPPNLGPLDVVLKISDNQATAMFTSPHSAVRDAVENAMPRLREMLADNGITLGNTMVSDQSPRDRSTNGFLGNGSGTAAQRDSSGDAPRLAGLSPVAAQPVHIRHHNGMVDTFA